MIKSDYETIIIGTKTIVECANKMKDILTKMTNEERFSFFGYVNDFSIISEDIYSYAFPRLKILAMIGLNKRENVYVEDGLSWFLQNHPSIGVVSSTPYNAPIKIFLEPAAKIKNYINKITQRLEELRQQRLEGFRQRSYDEKLYMQYTAMLLAQELANNFKVENEHIAFENFNYGVACYMLLYLIEENRILDNDRPTKNKIILEENFNKYLDLIKKYFNIELKYPVFLQNNRI
jgi:hypothetical protein